MSQLIPNTFGLSVTAKQVVTANTSDELLQAWQNATAQKLPVLILGEGSNTLFTENFSGVVIVNRIKGMTITESEQAWLLRVGAGENWHKLVEMTVNSGMSGLENLALIPGCVGSAPIQNIGAYGVEFKKFADYVELLELATGKIITITDGQYGYRESIFKHQYLSGYAVIYVGVRLPKNWQPVLAYGELQKMDPATVTAKMIFDTVCEVRNAKLPDPKKLGNGGSFFKNPVVEQALATKIQMQYPQMPAYPQADGSVKLAAGWLIDQCGLKGFQLGGAAVHEKQALVLVNKSQATSDDIVSLARHVRNQVLQKFGVSLEPEIRFMGRDGELNSLEVLMND